MKRTTLLFLGICLLALFACERNGKSLKPTPIPYPILQKYFSFPSGTQWVYDIAGTSDTSIDLAVPSDDVVTKFQSQEKPNNFSFSNDASDEMYVQYDDEWNSYGHLILCSEDSLFLPKIKNVSSSRDGLLDSVTINGTHYTDVIYSVDQSASYFREFFIAPNIGIIRKVEVPYTGVSRVFNLRRFTPAK